MTTLSDWWRDFFNGLATECWSKAVPEAATAEEADFIVGSLDVPPGGTVLDAPCGRGRLALPLTARGLRVTGLDYSKDEIAAARAAASARGLTVDWVQGDVRELPWQNQFDGAYCFGNSFAYFDDSGNTRLLQGVHRA